VLYKECNCNAIMVVTSTAKCESYHIFWAVIWAGLKFFGLVLGLFYEGIGLVFQPPPGNTGKEHVTRLD